MTMGHVASAGRSEVAGAPLFFGHAMSSFGLGIQTPSPHPKLNGASLASVLISLFFDQSALGAPGAPPRSGRGFTAHSSLFIYTTLGKTPAIAAAIAFIVSARHLFGQTHEESPWALKKTRFQVVIPLSFLPSSFVIEAKGR